MANCCPITNPEPHPDPYSVFSGPNAVDPGVLTREERRIEIAAIMAHGVLRRLSATVNKSVRGHARQRRNLLS